jgi:hypothetical protein
LVDLCWPLTVAAILFVAPRLSYSQQATPTKSHGHTKVSAAADSFVCPDPRAKLACSSYSELRKAHDPSLEGFAKEPTYICFREELDQFFLITFNRPVYAKTHWNQGLKQSVPDDDATGAGFGYATAFDNGVGSNGTMPDLFFTGVWRPLLGGSAFTATAISNNAIEDGKPSPITIDESQVTVSNYKYANTSDKTILYNLTIQRSTGRFTESFRMEDEKVSFIDNAGHCLVQQK